MKNYYEIVEENKIKSSLIIGGFIAFVSAAAYFISYAIGADSSALVIALIFSTFTSIGSFYYSDKIILSMSGARPATRNEFFDF